MKFSIVTAFSAVSVAQAWVTPMASSARTSTSLNAGVVYYSTSTGNTETIAGYIAEAAGCEIEDIGDVDDATIADGDSFMVGAPTWHTGADDQRSGTSWDDWLYENLPNIDVKGKKVAIFGCGDQESYGEYYCDAAGELYDQFTAAGATVFGATSTDGYEHTGSKAEVDGKFIGLMCDEDNQYDLSEDRAKAWVEQLKGEGFF